MKKILLTTVALLTLLLFFGCDPAGNNTQNLDDNSNVIDNEEDNTDTTDTTATVENLVITPETVSDLQVGFTEVITVIANYSDGKTKTVTRIADYTTSDYVSIYKGEITGTAVGTDTITVSYEGVSADFDVITVDNYVSLEASISEINANIGDSVAATFTLTKTDGTTETLTPDEGLVFENSDSFLYYNGELKIMDSASGTVTAKFASVETTINVNIPEYDFGDRRFISDEDLLLRAVSYSGYREGQDPRTLTYPTSEEIEEDLYLLKEAGFGFLRLYDTTTHARRTLEVIKSNPDLDFKILLGVWIFTESDTSNDDNWVQINGAFELSAPEAYGDIISAISVGNECMVDWNSWNPVDPSDMKLFIQYIRANVTQPVTTDDNWEPFSIGLDGQHSDYPDPVLPVVEVMDFVAMHTYPVADSPWGIWDWRQMDAAEDVRAVAMMDTGMQVAKDQYTAVRDGLDNNGLTDMPIVIGETGWKHTNTGNDWFNRCHPVNAKMYYDRMMDWVYGTGRGEGPLSCFYFEAFDEPWKQGDDGWGLFDVNREANYVLYAQDGSTFPAKAGESFTEDDAVYQPDDE